MEKLLYEHGNIDEEGMTEVDVDEMDPSDEERRSWKEFNDDSETERYCECRSKFCMTCKTDEYRVLKAKHVVVAAVAAAVGMTG